MSYYVHRNGQTLGPYTSNNVITMLRAHEFALDDLAVEEGCEDWQPLRAIVDPTALAAPPLAIKPSHPQPVPRPAEMPGAAYGRRQKAIEAPKRGTSVFTWICALILGAFMVAHLANLPEARDISGAEERAPWNAGKGFVLQSLKSPASAKFPGAYDEHVGWESIGPGRWAVWGHVDSQNPFGALIRNEWEAIVEHRETNWHRLYLHLGDQEIGDRNLWPRKAKATSAAAR